jgi:uncharacterized protein YegJ (DUF2314 family)
LVSAVEVLKETFVDAVYTAAKDDSEMLAAIDKARATFPEFLAEADVDIRRAIPVLDDVLIKVYVSAPDDPDAGEHLWVRYIGPDPQHEGRFRGLMLSTPLKVSGIVSKGDTVNLSIKSLSDWLYVKDGKAYGAFTVRVLRSRMSPAELNAHDAGYPFSFQ